MSARLLVAAGIPRCACRAIAQPLDPELPGDVYLSGRPRSKKVDDARRCARSTWVRHRRLILAADPSAGLHVTAVTTRKQKANGRQRAWYAISRRRFSLSAEKNVALMVCDMVESPSRNRPSGARWLSSAGRATSFSSQVPTKALRGSAALPRHHRGRLQSDGRIIDLRIPDVLAAKGERYCTLVSRRR